MNDHYSRESVIALIKFRILLSLMHFELLSILGHFRVELTIENSLVLITIGIGVFIFIVTGVIRSHHESLYRWFEYYLCEIKSFQRAIVFTITLICIYVTHLHKLTTILVWSRVRSHFIKCNICMLKSYFRMSLLYVTFRDTNLIIA